MSKFTGKTAHEISECVRTLVQDGELKPHDILPPVRELAQILDVNRNTVAAAYQRLVKAGIALSQGRLGTSICEPPKAGEQEGLSEGTMLVDLADGNPNPDWLPNLPATLSLGRNRPFLYGDDTILPELRDLGEQWLGPDSPAPHALELTHGAVDAIERLAFAHLVVGDKIAVEDPCFLGTINALRLAGLHTVGVRIDAAGMCPDALEAALNDGARAVLLTPRAHNPTGATLSQTRAAALKKILAKHPNVLIIVDDHFALIAGAPYHSVVPSSARQWALIRSVSKGLGPDMRLAMMTCDQDTGERLKTRLAPGMSWVSHILQTIVATQLSESSGQKALIAARDGYTQRRQVLCETLAGHGIEAWPALDGLNVWIPLPQDAKEIVFCLAQKGWLVRAGNAFDVSAPTNAIRVTISKLEHEQTTQFAADLAGCVHKTR